MSSSGALLQTNFQDEADTWWCVADLMEITAEPAWFRPPG
jgi:hypothetical protein